jgi:hypothetical protein
MGEQERDTDLEISSLEPSADTTTTARQSRLEALDPVDDDLEPPVPMGRLVSLAMRLSQQQRAASVVMLLVLFLSAVLVISPGNRAAVLHFLQPPTPFPTPTPIA